jgi:UDP-glucose 4-epimerase
MTLRTILVTGGAGYIGSHTVRALRAAGYFPVVFDDFSSGSRHAVPPGVPIVAADLADSTAIRTALETWRPESVVHFAAFIEAGESVKDPARFYANNVVNTWRLLQEMVACEVSRLVFSSSAGVYGQPERVPIPEEAPQRPVNPYGETKRIVEGMLRDYDRAYHLRSISLRYFNACGADPAGDIGEAHPNKTHLIELALLTALGLRSEVAVFGTDYPTPDGTAVRDYIHVVDLARAHLLALDALAHGQPTTAYNVGLGRGFSVQQVLDAVERVTGRPLPRRIAPRRPGDPAELVADPTRIRAELGWLPTYVDLDTILRTAWQWHRTHPHDFQDVPEPVSDQGSSPREAS